MNVRPLRDRVLAKRIEAQEQRIGGIIVPDTAKEKPQQAEVIAVGNLITASPPSGDDE